jgi:hypothetical protein
MSLIIKKNTTFKIPRTGSGAPSGIPVAGTASVTIANYTPHPNIVADNAQFFTANTTYTKMNNLEIFYGYAGLEVRSNGGVCYKTNLGNYDVAVLLPPNVSLETVNSGTFYSGVNKWRMAGQVSDDGIYIGLGFYVAGSTYNTDQYVLQNDSTDTTQIPTSGWYVFDRTTNTNLGASSITITAA